MQLLSLEIKDLSFRGFNEKLRDQKTVFVIFKITFLVDFFVGGQRDIFVDIKQHQFV